MVTIVDNCAQCVENDGLCRRCAERDRSLMPLLAESVLKWWMGLSLVEQKRLQLAESREVLRIKRRKARKAARRQELFTLEKKPFQFDEGAARQQLVASPELTDLLRRRGLC